MSDPSDYTPQPGDTVRWSKQPASATFEVKRRGWQDVNEYWHFDDPPGGGSWVKVPDLPPIPERWIVIYPSGGLGGSFVSLVMAQSAASETRYIGILHIMPDGTCEMLGVDDE